MARPGPAYNVLGFICPPIQAGPLIRRRQPAHRIDPRERSRYRGLLATKAPPRLNGARLPDGGNTLNHAESTWRFAFHGLRLVPKFCGNTAPSEDLSGRDLCSRAAPTVHRVR